MELDTTCKSKTTEYNSWKAMRNRCLSSRHKSNDKYQFVKICNRWIDNFDNFLSDMGNKPENSSLDRIDSSGNYEPSNCRWASHKQQQRNKDSTIKITHSGATKQLGEWYDYLNLKNVSLGTISKRYSYGIYDFELLFFDGRLKPTRDRQNKCTECKSTTSKKYYKNGKQCSNCYHKERRKNGVRINL